VMHCSLLCLGLAPAALMAYDNGAHSRLPHSRLPTCATCPSHSSSFILRMVLIRSAHVRLHPKQDACEHGGRHRPSDVGAGERHRRRSPPSGLRFIAPRIPPKKEERFTGFKKSTTIYKFKESPYKQDLYGDPHSEQ
jgi:hypothetical protein